MTEVIGTIDVAQIVLYAFWIFFAGLIFYLRREDRREGYPLESEDGFIENPGVVFMATPKSFTTEAGVISYAPRLEAPQPMPKGTPIDPWPGAPLTPNGDPMLAAIGPGAYADRVDTPDVYGEGHNRLVPMRADSGYFLESRDADPRGMQVIGADREVGGEVTDVWVDRAETVIRYLEIKVNSATPKTVLLPMPFCDVSKRAGEVYVNAILGRQFVNVPTLKNPDQVTLLEEDKICAYYGGGYLYATPQRSEPLL
ncbi:MAG: photosynthetic reaction center subunit H [Hyphomicrobiales bacterium]|nr:photosynthetic reaction center subunit H [Hyphomicrobiales bacterium]